MVSNMQETVKNVFFSFCKGIIIVKDFSLLKLEFVRYRNFCELASHSVCYVGVSSYLQIEQIQTLHIFIEKYHDSNAKLIFVRCLCLMIHVLGNTDKLQKQGKPKKVRLTLYLNKKKIRLHEKKKYLPTALICADPKRSPCPPPPSL